MKLMFVNFNLLLAWLYFLFQLLSNVHLDLLVVRAFDPNAICLHHCTSPFSKWHLLSTFSQFFPHRCSFCAWSCLIDIKVYGLFSLSILYFLSTLKYLAYFISSIVYYFTLRLFQDISKFHSLSILLFIIEYICLNK